MVAGPTYTVVKMTSPKDWSKVGPATSNTLFSESISGGMSTERATMIANNLT